MKEYCRLQVAFLVFYYIAFIIVVVISVLLARILPIYECIRTSATMTNIIEDFIYTHDTPTIVVRLYIMYNGILYNIIHCIMYERDIM